MLPLPVGWIIIGAEDSIEVGSAAAWDTGIVAWESGMGTGIACASWVASWCGDTMEGEGEEEEEEEDTLLAWSLIHRFIGVSSFKVKSSAAVFATELMLMVVD